jgi:protein phosphatase
MARVEVQLAWKTQAGHRHQVEGLENEDAVFVTEEHPVFDAVLMVADGMGGHPLPREASQAAVQAARDLLSDAGQLARAGDVSEALVAALDEANRAVHELRAPRAGGRAPGTGTRPPGTTLSIAVLAEGTLHVAHVGDGSVFLMRGGQVRALAGGEERRSGNRPAQYLGQEPPLEPEERRIALAEGDRLLLCTDGLTRYFREAGPEALERVLGREGVEIPVIASQLTAHSRPDDYDDDTTVALAEVTSFTRAPRKSPETGPRDTREKEAELDAPALRRSREEPGGSLRRPAFPFLPAVAAGLAGAGLLAAGFLAGRATAPKLGPPRPAITALREPASDEDLGSLPQGNVVLLDPLGRRVFTLATRQPPLGSAPISFQAFQVGAGGQFTAASRFRLDPVKQELTDSGDRAYPVEVDASSGTIRILRGGTLIVNTHPPRAAVYLDGKQVGLSPQKSALPAGRHRVRAEGRNWVDDFEVEVLPNRTVTISLGPK